MSVILLLAALLVALLVPALADAATITASSCNNTVANPDVETAVGLASNGDTVLIPDGSCTWTKPLVLTTKYLTIRGEHDCTLNGAGRPTSCPTVLTDGMDKSVDFALFLWTTISGGASRLAHLEIRSGSVLDVYNIGFIKVLGVSHQWRMDHMLLKVMKTTAYTFLGDVRGVNDHNRMVFAGWTSGSRINGMSNVHHDSWNNVGQYGDNSWNFACDWGGGEWLFFEDNEWSYDRSDALFDWMYAHDGWMGGRIVYRNNLYTNTIWANHGLESGGRQRSQRCTETYGNHFDLNLSASGALSGTIGPRGGEQLIYNNSVAVVNGTITAVGTFTYQRQLTYDTRPGATGCPAVADEPFGYPGKISLSSITRSGSTATATTTGTDHGFSLAKGCPYGCYLEIVGADQAEYNGVHEIVPTACDTFTFTVSGTPATPATGTMHKQSPWDGNTNNYGFPALDQIGRGAHVTPISGDQPVPRTANDQVDGPSYCWGNTINTVLADCDTNAFGANWVQEDRDYFNSAKPGYTAYPYPHPLQGVVASSGSGSMRFGPKGNGLF